MVCAGLPLVSASASAVRVMLAGAPNCALATGEVRLTVGGLATLMVLAAEVLVPPRLSEALVVSKLVPARYGRSWAKQYEWRCFINDSNFKL